MREWLAGALGLVIAFLVVTATDTLMLTIYPLPPGTVVSLETLPEIARTRPAPAAAAFGAANLLGPLLGAWVAARLARRAQPTVAIVVTTTWAVLASIDAVLVGIVWPIAVLWLVLPLAGCAIGRAMSSSPRARAVIPAPSTLSVQ